MTTTLLGVPGENAFFQHSTLPTKSSSPEPWSEVLELPPQRFEDQGKLTVVLDIDETLVHTETTTALSSQDPVEDVFFLEVQGTKLKVRKRPFLDQFLLEAADKFELIAYTAGSEEYATPLLLELDPKGTIFRHRLFRQHCLFKCGDNFVKDLRIVNRSLERTVLVDNNAHSFLLQLGNGIPIASFIDDTQDQALVTLFYFLHMLIPETDVRQVLSRIFRLEAMLGELAQSAIAPVTNNRLDRVAMNS